MRLLLVDDDPGLRALLRTTFEVVDVDLDEAENASVAAERMQRQRPDVIVLDVGMPGISGLEFCRRLKADPGTRDIPVVVLTGTSGNNGSDAARAGADAFLLKPFSPLELLAIVERLSGGLYDVPFRSEPKQQTEEQQLLLYARDLRHMLELERAQRRLLESAYHETVTALATALDSKDAGTRQHSQRVQRYAIALTAVVDPPLAQNQSAQYGFLLHDVGKIGIPDRVLQKPGPLDEAETQLMQSHTVLGEQVLGGVAFLQTEGLQVVRSHHERWDGTGYPDALARDSIPLGARVFAVADTLDAMTSDRPYRRAGSWQSAREEIVSGAGRQFDPDVVAAFVDNQAALQEVHTEFLAAA